MSRLTETASSKTSPGATLSPNVVKIRTTLPSTPLKRPLHNETMKNDNERDESRNLKRKTKPSRPATPAPDEAVGVTEAS